MAATILYNLFTASQGILCERNKVEPSLKGTIMTFPPAYDARDVSTQKLLSS